MSVHAYQPLGTAVIQEPATLSKDECREMRLVGIGSDVCTYTSAQILRGVQQRFPEYVTIEPADQAKHHAPFFPYFYARVTREGWRAQVLARKGGAS